MDLVQKEAYCISELPWKKERQAHSLHSLCSRICSFPPSLVRYFIQNYSSEGEIIFDPFSGKGTLALEALLNKRIGWGNDISPEAYVLTNAKISDITISGFFKFLERIEKKMGFLKTTNGIDHNIKVFYNNETLIQILELKEILSKMNDKYSIFAKAVLLGILHGSSSCSLSLRCSHSYSMSPNYVKNYAQKHNLIKPKRDVIECIRNKAIVCLKDDLPKIKGKAFNCDSRKLKIPPSSVDLIITSPPYFAVQTYAYDNWLRLWFLGYDYKKIHHSLVNTNSEEKYGDFMYLSFKEMFRVLKKDKKCFIVVGDVKKSLSKNGQKITKIINTAEFLSHYAEKAGFVVENIINDKIPQGKKVLNSYLNTEGISTERILCLRK